MDKIQKQSRSLNNRLSQTFAIHTGVFLGRVLPRRIGLALTDGIGKFLGRNKTSPMVRAIRANQWVIHDQSLSSEQLDQLPVTIFQSAARCMFDYFYFLSRPKKLQSVIELSPEAQQAIDRIRLNQPTVIVCPHLSNFDLMGYALALNELKLQVLSFPNPGAAYRLQNKIRERVGLKVTPMTLTAFQQARNRLRNGGSVLTGLDRPLENAQKYRPTFFGHPCSLPVTYVRLAKEANAPVILMAATSKPDHSYRLIGSHPIWMKSFADLETEILFNANRVLSKAAPLIRTYAHQWAMFYPIWPQYLGV
ncbi:MAG: lysophospholipid acyltransferase family protein [Brevefilum sp.]